MLVNFLEILVASTEFTFPKLPYVQEAFVQLPAAVR